MATAIQQDDRRGPDGRGKLTGWHVLAMLGGFFGVMFVANGFLVYYAIGTFSGTVTDSSYQASQQYNIYLAAARAQQLRDWHVTADAKREADGTVNMRIVARNADDVPIEGVDFHATLQRPTSRAEDRQVDLTPILGEPGAFTGTASNVPLGQWTLVVAADTDRTPGNDADRPRTKVGETSNKPHLFESEHRMMFK
ncbi:MAG: FixH family protein [Ancalomicrobiaceae bacterium]|nr:FixH family protein [Ancalomicrobiaceae bacterium]